MRCDLAEQLISAALDEALPEPEAVALHDHQGTCASCCAFAEDVAGVRQRLRVQLVGDVPDVTLAVRARLESEPRRRSQAPRVPSLLRVAAAFVGAFLVSAVVVAQLAPAPVHAENLGALVVAAQSRVSAMSADLTVVERGWHPAVPERRYDGTLQFEAPESVRVRLEDRTAYPSGQWMPNTTDWFVDDELAAVTALRPCPTSLQPSCSASGPRTETWEGRAPFDPDVPAPLDLVVPSSSFALTGPVDDVGIRTIDGTDALGVRVTAAQAKPLLDGILHAGNWRDVHHSDVTEVWLDADSLTPLRVEVLPADSTERRLWSAARGFDDPLDEPFLVLALHNVRFGSAATGVQRPPRTDAADATDAGFVTEADPPDAVTPAWLPEGATEHRAGRRGNVTITSWTDGRAWLRIQATPSWKGDRLFGDLGALVHRRNLGTGIAYSDGHGTAISLHGDELDVAVHGSYDAETMLRIAGSLPVTGRPVPSSWPQGNAVTAQQAAQRMPGLLVAQDLEGFAEPAVTVRGATATSGYTGAGARGFLLMQTPGSVLSPPFDADVLGVGVRGHPGRFTPSRGTLEWVESEHIVALDSDSLGLGELLVIAELLGPVQ